MPAASVADSGSCPLYCMCRHDNCYYGNDPCVCNGPVEACKENETLDPVTGGKLFILYFRDQTCLLSGQKLLQ